MKSIQQLIKCWPPTLLKSTCKIRKDAGLIGHSSALSTQLLGDLTHLLTIRRYFILIIMQERGLSIYWIYT